MGLITLSEKKMLETFMGPMEGSMRSGRSTRLCFEILARCYAQQGTWQNICDHEVEKESSEDLAGLLSSYLVRLNFNYFQFRKMDKNIQIRLLPLEERVN